MTGQEKRPRETSSSPWKTDRGYRDRPRSVARWRTVMIVGAAGAIPGFYAYTMCLSHPGLATTEDWIVNSGWFFGSLLLLVIGFLGYSSARHRERLERERGSDASPR